MRTLFISLLLLLSVYVASVQATLPNAVQLHQFIDEHNVYRQNTNPPATNMPAVGWDASLANSAQAWAAQCIWAHSGTPNVGENLYATTNRYSNPAQYPPKTAVDAWGSEGVDYTFSTNTCASGHICGHYTQIVWASSTTIGCAFQDCPTIQGLPWANGGTITVCQYKPPGNFVGQRPYTQENTAVNWTPFLNMSMKEITYKGTEVWALDWSGFVYRLQNLAWVQKPGIFRSIGVGVDGWAWAATSSGNLWRWSPVSNSWQSIPLPSDATAVYQVDGNSQNNALIIDNLNRVWFYYSGQWAMLYQGASSVALGVNNDVWMIKTDGTIARLLWSVGWITIPGGCMEKIRVSDLQNIVVTSRYMSLWRYLNNAWTQLPGSGRDVAQANGQLYMIDPCGTVYVSQ